MDYHSPYFFGYLLGLIHLLGIVAALHAIFTVRTAQGAIAWAMPLVFIPYLTLIPYLVFGARSFYATSRPGARPTRKCTWPWPVSTGGLGGRSPDRP